MLPRLEGVERRKMACPLICGRRRYRADRPIGKRLVVHAAMGDLLSRGVAERQESIRLVIDIRNRRLSESDSTRSQGCHRHGSRSDDPCSAPPAPSGRRCIRVAVTTELCRHRLWTRLARGGDPALARSFLTVARTRAAAWALLPATCVPAQAECRDDDAEEQPGHRPE